MLLRFTSPDMLNSSLIDVSSGQRAYNIVTNLLPPKPETVGENDTPESPISSSSPLSTSQERRHTTITDGSGNALVTITWTGRQPDITILDENVGGLSGLFGSSTIRFMYVTSSCSAFLFAHPHLGRKSWQFQHGLIQNKYG